MERLRTISDINIFIDSLLYKSASGQLPENTELTVKLNQNEYQKAMIDLANLISLSYRNGADIMTGDFFTYQRMGVKVTIIEDKEMKQMRCDIG